VAGDDTGVHQARVASRRLREAVPVLAAGLKRGRKATRKIRKVTRALGTVRELDVTVKILDELAQRPSIPRLAIEDVRAHVTADRDRRRSRMVARLKDVNTAKLNRRLLEVSDELASDPGEWRTVLARRIASRARRLATAIREAGPLYAPDRLHDVRIAVKKLRYALELAADARVTAVRPLLGRLKRIQDTLGRLNDLHVILGHVAAVQADPPPRRGAAVGGLDIIAGALEDECRHLHARYVTQAPSLTELTATCRSAVAAHLAPPARAARIRLVRDGDVRAGARRA
jgi:CHAD domain-containing protein